MPSSAKKGAKTATTDAENTGGYRKAPKSTYSDVTGSANRRHWTVAILMQIGIRIRYLFESWFGVQPLFHDLAEFPSPWRPKTCPK